MIDDNITAVIRYFINETMRFDESTHVYGTPVNISDELTSTVPPQKHTTTSNNKDSSLQNAIIIPLYAVIFGCCVVGNLFVILTLAQNKRMRTVTNVYLLNLVSC